MFLWIVGNLKNQKKIQEYFVSQGFVRPIMKYEIKKSFKKNFWLGIKFILAWIYVRLGF